LLDAANGPWLGIAESRPIEVVVPFAVGTQLVMYTDGLVERRNRTFDAGIAEMVAVVSSHHTLGQPDELIDLVLDTLLDDGIHDDDIAVLVLKSVTSGSAARPPSAVNENCR
jgi:serine phosphatase RsbU (regulator of sigma subunit)